MTQTNQVMWPSSQGALGWEGGRGAGRRRELKSGVLRGGKQDQWKEPNTISCHTGELWGPVKTGSPTTSMSVNPTYHLVDEPCGPLGRAFYLHLPA